MESAELVRKRHGGDPRQEEGAKKKAQPATDTTICARYFAGSACVSGLEDAKRNVTQETRRDFHSDVFPKKTNSTPRSPIVWGLFQLARPLPREAAAWQSSFLAPSRD